MFDAAKLVAAHVADASRPRASAPYVLIVDDAVYRKPASENMAFAVDFSVKLQNGEIIESAAWSIPDAESMLTGVPSIKGARVIQAIAGGAVNARYAPQCTATTNTGRTITLPEQRRAFIEITN